MTQPPQAPGTLASWFAGVHQRVRGVGLLALASPLLPEAISELVRGRIEPLVGAVGAGGLVLAAFMRLRQSPNGAPGRRDTWMAGLMVGAAALIAALVNAGYSLPMSLVFGMAAGFGTVFAYGPAKETVLPDLSALKPALPPDPETAARLSLEARAAALVAAPETLPRGDFARAVARVAGLARAMLAEAREDPSDFGRIRRFLGVYLEQLETLVARYRAAHPAGGSMPESLAAVLADLERAFEEKLAELRAHDLKALDVEREVLAQRLAEQLAMPPTPAPQETPR